jgi:hypothetical protein
MNRGRRFDGLAAGIGLGLLALLNPASVTVAAVWLGYRLWRRPARTALFVSCAALAAAATVAPWMWRNYREFHRLFFIRDNFGLELYIANNDRAAASFAQNEISGEHTQVHPGRSAIESREFQALGEAEYMRRRQAAAFAWIRRHPARFAALTAARIRMFWLPDNDYWAAYAHSIAFVTLAAALGLAQLARRREPIVVFFTAALLVYPALYYFVQSDLRYRTPVLWISLLAGGYFLGDLAKRLRAPRAT